MNPTVNGFNLLHSSVQFCDYVMLQTSFVFKVFALYQITVVYGGRHVCRWSVSPEMVVWLHLIDPVTVDWTGGSGTRSACMDIRPNPFVKGAQDSIRTFMALNCPEPFVLLKLMRLWDTGFETKTKMVLTKLSVRHFLQKTRFRSTWGSLDDTNHASKIHIATS